MKKRCSENYAWLKNSRRKIAILLSINRPMTKTEIENKVRNDLSLSEKSNIRLKGFILRKLIFCLNPDSREGRVYGLTDEGHVLAVRVSKEKGISWNYSNPDIDWNIFGWIACGKRRRKKLKDIVSSGKAITSKPTPEHKSSELIKDTPRSYKYRLLVEFCKKGLLSKSVEKGISIYKPTEKAVLMAELLKS